MVPAPPRILSPRFGRTRDEPDFHAAGATAHSDGYVVSALVTVWLKSNQPGSADELIVARMVPAGFATESQSVFVAECRQTVPAGCVLPEPASTPGEVWA